MPMVTFQVLEGIDKGRSFRELPTPISIGREEGNVVRLNDERVSRFPAKVQADNEENITLTQGILFPADRPLPPLPEKTPPPQAARLAEMLDLLHRHLNAATENIRANEEGTQVTLTFADWQRIQTIQMLLARYVRAVTEPDVMAE